MSDVNTDNEELLESTTEEENALDKFYEDNKDKLVESPDKTREEGLNRFLWDDWELLNQYARDNISEEVYLCTVVTGEDETAWIVKGRKWVNRMGYFLSKKPFIMEDEDVRYW